jgi:hypothetical protein
MGKSRTRNMLRSRVSAVFRMSDEKCCCYTACLRKSTEDFAGVREIAGLEKLGYRNKRGNTFSPPSIASMLA